METVSVIHLFENFNCLHTKDLVAIRLSVLLDFMPLWTH